MQRRDAVLAAVDQIVAADGKLTKDDINSTASLRPMRSVTNFLAVPFPFNGFTHVLIEGNGRMKGLQLAAKQNPDQLPDVKVEVDLLDFSPESLLTVQEGILQLWNQYVEEAWAMSQPSNQTTQPAKITEYLSFAVAVVKCLGTTRMNGGWFASRGECNVVNGDGQHVRTIPVGTLIGVQGKRKMPNGGTRYKLYPGSLQLQGELVNFGNDEYLSERKDDEDMVALEYCPKCTLLQNPSYAGAGSPSNASKVAT